ncbi:XRE family transcriptional regulator [Bosea sp. 62]|uniref:helix-turn-helix domain-containing protein n=2 Tax=Bosea TaxID=85413 RepID=UPI001254D9D0|nr:MULTISPECIES: helix-turn-helix transcriptional regulator [unclassified Bosea (in: a-proteobacteria)]CAD5291951.1 XRE family transcriptional regulator [Bosea sp. 46]CAD5300621.1 XRE family transcriptional regulator [Bosea sp. 7B]VVT60772.1 XRE family transcriptional regulator [Bosea sp. EC-HK365B]VXC05628.1 XRE family transcriptional regulator [Bosea sp. 62]VXC59172.1 XRE family transcriptional regulator [Bosea sp. 127]
MHTSHDERATTKRTLGQYLAGIRLDRKMSLRAVEEATNKQVSNAYLSQIENDKIQQPSPNILHALAELYAISFENLMEMAGYLMGTSGRSDTERHGRVATFAEHNLTADEETEMLQYLQFMRNRKKPGDKT